MRIGVLGINHKSADLKTREAVASACQKLFRDLDVVLLSTCNRTEIYFSHFDLASFHSETLHALQKEIATSFEHSLYSYFGRDCFFHLACVTAGLDSAVIAESDIQRQVKLAYAEAAAAQKLSSPLHFLFQKCLKIGKWARSNESIFKMSVSLEQIIFRLVETMFPSSFSILFAGNSEVNRKIIRLFTRRGIRRVSLATRTPHAAEAFALDHGISLADSSLLQEWDRFDIVISGTNHGDYVIKNITNAPKTRLILDLCVPRSVHPDIHRHTSITLLNIEQVGHLASGPRQNQSREVSLAKEKIGEAVGRSVASYEKKVCAYC
jgi:glutamyl-tRNA reductase